MNCFFLKKKGKLRKIAKCTYQNSIAATVDTLFSSSCLLFPLECRMLADYIKVDPGQISQPLFLVLVPNTDSNFEIGLN